MFAGLWLDDRMSATQSMPTEPWFIGKKMMSGTKVITSVVSIKPAGVNYRVMMKNGYGVVVPPRYIADECK
jgi:hypothetical protein